MQNQNSSANKCGVAVIAASEFNKEKFLEMKNANLFEYYVAVDGGYERFVELEMVPDIALGDFDSLGYEPTGIRRSMFPREKDDSDLELTLERLFLDGYRQIYIFGALGGRLDHTLASLRSCAIASRRGCDIEMIGISEHIIFLTGEGYFERNDLTDCTDISPATVSLMPILSPCKGLFIRGLKYESDDAKIDDNGSLCLSNETTDDPILIGLEKGTIAIIINTA
jgi:thiamine pyrophosphokinase